MTTPKRRRPVTSAASLAVAVCMMLFGAPARADQAENPSRPETAPVAIAIVPSRQFDAGLEDGGRVGVSGYLVDATANLPLSESLGVGLHFAYEFADFRFSAPAKFAQAGAWGEVYRLELGGNVGYDLTPEWSVYVAPAVQVYREADAGWSNALEYGGDLTVTKDFGPALTLGFGLEGFNELGQVWLCPLLVVNWKVTDRLTLTNPSRPGPVGQTGLEVAYRAGGGWEVGGGAAYLSNRFRLKDAGGLGAGIAETRAVPVWGRLSRGIGKHFNLDLYAGAMIAGEVEIEDRAGGNGSDRYDPAPFLALALSTRF